MKKEQRDVWIADDDEEFDTELECKYHEVMLTEEALISEFLDTQRWDPKENKGYADRTLTTMRRIMSDFIKFKVERNAYNAPAQTDTQQPRSEV